MHNLKNAYMHVEGFKYYFFTLVKMKKKLKS